jgi:hypothetical protein
MTKAWRYASVLAAVLSGCGYMQRQDAVQQVLSQPAPADAQRRSQDCATIATQIARQVAVRDDKAAAVEAPFEHAKAKARAESDIAALKARQSELDCASAPPPQNAAAPAQSSPAAAAVAAPPAASQADEGFDRCFERCRRYTDRTKEQCFDICNAR